MTVASSTVAAETSGTDGTEEGVAAGPPPGGRPGRGRRRPAVPREAGEVYRALAPAVLGYLRAERAPEAEDVCGEVFLQVVRDLPRFRGDDDALRRWVFTIAHHRLVDTRRRLARRPRVVGRALPEQASPGAAGGPDPELTAALAGLTSDQRRAVLLRFVADLPVEAVAKVMGRSQGAVKALQHRALEALAERLRGG